MGGVSHTVAWWWDFFKRLFGINDYFVRGFISLANGRHEVQIQTDPLNGKPYKVYIWVSEPTPGVCVCLGDVNLVGSTIVPDGFVLYADIKSNVADVYWLIEYDSNPIDTDTGKTV